MLRSLTEDKAPFFLGGLHFFGQTQRKERDFSVSVGINVGKKKEQALSLYVPNETRFKSFHVEEKFGIGGISFTRHQRFPLKTVGC